MIKVDYIVVGLGIAGAQFCQELEKLGKSFVVFDDDRIAASNIAAGLMNPITGRNYAKSWRIDELIPKAISSYRWFEELLGQKYCHDLDIRRILNSISEENKWASRLDDEGYSMYLDAEISDTSGIKNFLSTDKIIKVKKGRRVDLSLLLSDYKAYLSQQKKCLNQTLDHKAVNWEVKSYKGYEFQRMVCCEGALGKGSPFSFLPVVLNLGEVFLVHLSESLPFAIKKKVFIVPLGDHYWVGGTYSNISETDEVIPNFEKLKSWFEEAYQGPYEILEQIYGIRPTVPDRRPLLGLHPEIDDLFVLNGLGTKGTSLSPLMAQELLDFIEKSIPLSDEINISRYT